MNFRYLARSHAGTNLALLTRAIRSAFPIDESVNDALRSLIHGQTRA